MLTIPNLKKEGIMMFTMIRASLFFVMLSISVMTASSHARMDDSDVSPERLTASMSRQADLDKFLDNREAKS